MDNEGLYISYEELIAELYNGQSAKVTSSDITLANKAVEANGDTYEYSGTGTPEIGAVLYQAGYVATIIELLTTPNRVRINKTGTANKIKNGTAKILKAPSLPQATAEELIKDAMDFIDTQTGQFFNKRSGTFKLEGNNSSVMHFPVPIIEIEELLINSTDQELFEGEDKDFVAFTGRSMPQDDRRNPRIKLNVGRGRDSIFVGTSSRVFSKNTLTHITGSFGFLEPDGSTPRLIKKACKILVLQNVNAPISSTSGTGDTGPVKRIKVDLHEKEFFEPTSNKESGSQVISGSEEVDEIMAKYRTPIRISGSFIRSPYEDAQL